MYGLVVLSCGHSVQTLPTKLIDLEDCEASPLDHEWHLYRAFQGLVQGVVNTY